MGAGSVSLGLVALGAPAAVVGELAAVAAAVGILPTVGTLGVELAAGEIGGVAVTLPPKPTALQAVSSTLIKTNAINPMRGLQKPIITFYGPFGSRGGSRCS